MRDLSSALSNELKDVQNIFLYAILLKREIKLKKES